MDRSGLEGTIERPPRRDAFPPAMLETEDDLTVAYADVSFEALRDVSRRGRSPERSRPPSESTKRVSIQHRTMRPIFYASERCLRLRDIIMMMNDERLRRTTRRAGDMEVYVVRTEAGPQRSARSEPKAIGDCLYIDVRDYMALRDGVHLPRVGDAIRKLLDERTRATGFARKGV